MQLPNVPPAVMLCGFNVYKGLWWFPDFVSVNILPFRIYEIYLLQNSNNLIIKISGLPRLLGARGIFICKNT